jgi:hypothetical protein
MAKFRFCRPTIYNGGLGEEDLNEAIAYAYPCPKKRAEERQRFQQKAISRVFASDLNGEYWRHCITLNLGNGMSVCEKEAKRRLNYLRVRLLKAMFGNSWRRMGSTSGICCSSRVLKIEATNISTF